MTAMKAIFLTFAIAVCAVGCGLWPAGSDAPSDPIEFAIHLATLGRDRDWEEMRSLMVEEFRDFDLDAIEWAVRWEGVPLTFAAQIPGYDDPDSWRAQQFNEAVIVQLKEAPIAAFMLRKNGDGNLEFDPGPRTRQWADWVNKQYARGLDWDDLVTPSVKRSFDQNTAGGKPPIHHRALLASAPRC